MHRLRRARPRHRRGVSPPARLPACLPPPAAAAWLGEGAAGWLGWRERAAAAARRQPAGTVPELPPSCRLAAALHAAPSRSHRFRACSPRSPTSPPCRQGGGQGDAQAAGPRRLPGAPVCGARAQRSGDFLAPAPEVGCCCCCRGCCCWWALLSLPLVDTAAAAGGRCSQARPAVACPTPTPPAASTCATSMVPLKRTPRCCWCWRSSRVRARGRAAPGSGLSPQHAPFDP